MRDVAREAGVAVETVYANFRSKTELLMAAIDVSVVGDADPVPLSQRPEFTRLSSGSFAVRVASAARLLTGINQRVSGLHRALREAAASEPDLGQKLREIEQRRLTNVQAGAELMTGHRLADDRRDGLWAIVGSDVFDLLTGIAGWSPQRYEAWLTETLAVLLADGGRYPEEDPR
jgi:AcrR family transcriptional regulator